MRSVLWLCLTMVLAGCNPYRLTSATTPQIGWTMPAVERALGVSLDRTTAASGWAVWRYNVAPGRFVGYGCNSHHACLAIYFDRGVVQDIVYR